MRLWKRPSRKSNRRWQHSANRLHGGPDIKASDDFLDPLFRKFYEKLGLLNLMRKTDY
jgi:hypothetical protein